MHRAGAIDKGLLNIGPLVAGDVEAINRGLTNWAMQDAQPEFIRLHG